MSDLTNDKKEKIELKAINEDESSANELVGSTEQNNNEQQSDNQEIVQADLKTGEQKQFSQQKNEQKILKTDEYETMKRKKWYKSVPNIIVCSILFIVAIFGGNFVGDMIVNNFLNVADFSKTEEELREKDIDINSWTSLQVSQMSAMQAYLVAEKKLREKTQFIIEVTGGLKAAIVDQSVYSYNYCILNEQGKLCYGSKYLSKSSMVQVATGYTYISGEEIKKLKGNDITETTATWSDNGTIGYDEYKEQSGMFADRFGDYIVSKKTIKESECINPSKKEDGYYHFKLSLNNYSTVNYVKKMKYVAGTSATRFDKIELDVTIDENANFIKMEIHEQYVALGVVANSSLLQTFNYTDMPTF